MIIVKTIEEYRIAKDNLGKGSVGFVPTMGALHKGHISLVKRAVETCEHCVVSIFVNPTQFNDPDDLKKYPRTLEADSAMLAAEGVDIVFAPDVEVIYPEKDERVFNLDGLDNYGEGPRRPGHFNGVVQVVTRLFDIVKPQKAFFGEKDFQQLAIIRHMVSKLNYPVEIVGCSICREDDGLAMSSRNTLLTPEQRKAAPEIYKAISKVAISERVKPSEVAEIVKKEIDSNKLLKTEYVEIINVLTLQPVNDWNEADELQLCCAVVADPIRLIDNVKLR